MPEKYSIVNIRTYIDKDSPTYICDESLKELLSEFSCQKNPEVEHFLLHNAIEFTKKDQSVTYLVFNKEDASLVGYYSLALKPFSIRTSVLSKTSAKKLSRGSVHDKDSESYTAAAYLIAQLGKNYALPKSKQISGINLLRFALKTIVNLKYSIGGVIEFLECEDNEFLLNFYKENHFKPFETRTVISSVKNTPYRLHQLYKFV